MGRKAIPLPAHHSCKKCGWAGAPINKKNKCRAGHAARVARWRAKRIAEGRPPAQKSRSRKASPGQIAQPRVKQPPKTPEQEREIWRKAWHKKKHKQNRTGRKRYPSRRPVAAERPYTPAELESARARTKTRQAHYRAGDVTGAQLREIFERSGRRCHYCSVEVNARCERSSPRGFDHVIPFAKGGKHTASNIVVCCRACNTKKCTQSLAPARPEQEAA